MLRNDEEDPGAAYEHSLDFEALDEALDRLPAMDPQQTGIVELHFIGRLSVFVQEVDCGPARRITAEDSRRRALPGPPTAVRFTSAYSAPGSPAGGT